MTLVGDHYLTLAQIESMRAGLRVTYTEASIWSVERVDGDVRRFASHDKVIRFRGQDYLPLGPNASDMEHAEAGAESDFEMVGFLCSDTIRASDIHAGRYDGCRVVHHVVDWMRPWIWHRRHVWWVREINESGGVFRAQVQGVERFLVIPAGRLYERECDKVLGSKECGALPRALFGATVEVVASAGATILGLPHKNMAMRFTTGSWTWSPAVRDGLLAQGEVRWTAGPNKGTTQRIGEHIGREITLEEATPVPIKAGDVCAVFSGCDGTRSACDGDYSNGDNFGGQPFMPSTEDTYKKPSEV